MRKASRALVLILVSIVASVVLAASSVFAGAFAFGAVALLVPGTGTPDANIVADYRQNIRDRYLQTTTCTNEANCPADPDLQGIDYPASFWPLAVFPSWCRSGPDGCDKWNVSVGKGAEALTTALTAALASPEDEIVVFGYSQGGAVVSKVLNEYELTEAQKARLRVVTIGGIQNPDGGLWQRLAFLGYIPILDITFGPPMPVEPGIKTTTYGFEYDPVVYAPRYWGNPFAMLNAIAAFDNVHGYYLAPNGNGPTDTLPYGYTPATLAPHLVCNVGVNCRLDQYGNEYIMIPATSQPFMNLILSVTPSFLTPLVKPIVDLVSPAYKVLADLGYDWSGNPGTPTPLSILPFNPFQNWVDVGVKLVAAVIQGIQDAINGGPTLAVPPTLPETTSTLAARAFSAPSGEEQPAVEESHDVAELASVTELRPAGADAGQQPPVTEPVAVEIDSTEGVDEVKGVDGVESVTDTEDATVDDTETDETKTDETKTDETKTDEATPETNKPVEKDEPKTSIDDKDTHTKDEAKTDNAKPTNDAGKSDDKDSGADDKKAAA